MKYLNYFQYNAPVILTYFFICLITLFINKLTKNKTNFKFFSTSRDNPLNPLTYLNMFTHILGHDSWTHLRNNFLYILLIGPMIEEKYGSIPLLKMILTTALLTSLINMIIGNKRILGSSGISFMLIILSSITNIVVGKIPITLVLIFFFYVASEIIDGITKKDNISHLSHIIGAITGSLFGYYYF